MSSGTTGAHTAPHAESAPTGEAADTDVVHAAAVPVAHLDVERSKALYERAVRVTPGGVNSPVRALRSVGRAHPLFAAKGAGATLTDVDGNAFTDWMLSWGALPLGHADAAVVEAIVRAVRDGSSFGAPTQGEVELAELITSAVPSVERVRFTSSGTEATMSAIRVARAATGREAILTFAGNYHGHADAFLATGGSGLATLGIPSSPGVPAGVVERTLVAKYNDVDGAAALVEAAGVELAAIIVEPVAANMGVVLPEPGFLEGLRALADRLGAVLVFDEVITGFRLGWGGAQGRFGVRPDLTTFGKVIGGGLPVGAFGGRADLMDQVAPAGSVYQAGTLSGNPAAMAAGIAQLSALRDRDAFTELDRLGARLAQGLRAAIDRTGARAAVAQVGSLTTLFHLTEGHDAAPRDFAQAQAALDTEDYARAWGEVLARGHYLAPSQFEAMFCSTAHADADVDAVVAAVEASLAGGVAQ